MKNKWMKRISIALAALLLLAVLPLSAMAEKETKTEAKGTEITEASEMTEVTATVSDASKEIATSSDAYEDGELLDGEVHDDLPPVEEEAALTDDITPAEPEALPVTEPVAVSEEVPEKEIEADITGFWTVDGITNYWFDENGIGELILPEHEFSFNYTVEEDELTLEFEDTSIGTAVFTFTVEDDRLILKREEEAGTSEFILEKTTD